MDAQAIPSDTYTAVYYVAVLGISFCAGFWQEIRCSSDRRIRDSFSNGMVAGFLGVAIIGIFDGSDVDRVGHHSDYLCMAAGIGLASRYALKFSESIVVFLIIKAFAVCGITITDEDIRPRSEGKETPQCHPAVGDSDDNPDHRRDSESRGTPEKD